VTDGTLESQEVTVTIIIDAPPPPTHQNPNNRLDVSANGIVSPIDALLIINHLNDPDSQRNVAFLPAPPPYLDVDGNDVITPSDALQIIMFLNDRSLGGGAGESAGMQAPVIVSRALDNSSVQMNEFPVFGPILPAGLLLAEAESAQWVDLSWIDRSPHQGSDKEELEDVALLQLMEEFK
jgi:hypothetical protein